MPKSAVATGGSSRLSVAEPLIQASLVGEAIDRGPVAILVADEDMRYVAVNAFACELLGYEREELLTLGIPDVSAAARVDDEFQAFVAAGIQSGTYTVRRKDGTHLEISYHAKATTIAGMSFFVTVFVPS